MGLNTRGKVKEHLEGCHKNTEAIMTHLAKIDILVGDKSPTVNELVRVLGEVTKQLDDFIQDAYSKV